MRIRPLAVAPIALAALLLAALLLAAAAAESATPATAAETAAAAPDPAPQPMDGGPGQGGGPGPEDVAPDPLVAELRLPVAGQPVVLDWGRVGLEQLVEGVIRVSNTSAETIRVLAMRPSCQCTALDDLSGTEIAPGETAEARVTVETGGITGLARNQVRFVFSDRSTATVELLFRASRSVEAEPTFISALDVAYGVVKIRSIDGRPFRILSAHGEEPIYAFDHDPDRDGPRSEYLLVWNVEDYDPETCLNEDGEPMPLWWVIETDHPGAPLVDLRVRHDPCTRLDAPRRGTPRRWFLSRNHVVLGRMPAGTAREFDVEMKWLRDAVVNDTIARVSEDDDRFDAELVDVVREGDVTVATIRVTLADDARGLVYGRLTVHGEDPRSSQFMPVVVQAADPATVAADLRR